MNFDMDEQPQQEDKPLTQYDVKILLQKVGSPNMLNLSGRNLEEIWLGYFHLEGADFTAANLVHANLVATNLVHANLTSADLSGANLTSADLSGANLTRATLTNADLSFTHLNVVNFTDAILAEANLSGAYLMRANLSGANLSGAYLAGADLTDANLSGADLSGADLSGAYLMHADLSGADLSGADLSDAYLSGANIVGANIVGANFTDAIDVEEVEVIRISIAEEPLTPHNLTSILSSLTELATKCWLIGKSRFADLIEYTQTHDVRFVEETQLTFTRITYNSPFDASFNIDLSATNVVEAIVTAADGAIQWKKRREKAELENKEKAQVLELAKQKADDESEAAALEREKQKLAIERERLEIFEKRLETINRGLSVAIEIATKTVNVMHPNADDQTKNMLIQTLVPTILQTQNSNGLELFLPAPQTQSDEEKK